MSNPESQGVCRIKGRLQYCLDRDQFYLLRRSGGRKRVVYVEEYTFVGRWCNLKTKNGSFFSISRELAQKKMREERSLIRSQSDSHVLETVSISECASTARDSESYQPQASLVIATSTEPEDTRGERIKLASEKFESVLLEEGYPLRVIDENPERSAILTG